MIISRMIASHRGVPGTVRRFPRGVEIREGLRSLPGQLPFPEGVECGFGFRLRFVAAASDGHSLLPGSDGDLGVPAPAPPEDRPAAVSSSRFRLFCFNLMPTVITIEAS